MKWPPKKSYNKKICLIVSVFSILALQLIPLTACKATPQEEIKLTLVSGWSTGVAFNDKLMKYIEMVNKDGKGKVFIDFKGGPEVAPITEAVGLVKKGVYDMAFNTMAYYGGLSPSCVPLCYAPGDPVLLRKLGVADLVDKIMRDEMQIAFLGWLCRGEPFTIVSKKPITSADFHGMLMHTLPMLTPALTYLGASTKTLQVPEFYQALQTGLVDAIPCPAATVPMDYKLYDVAKYLLYPLFTPCTSQELMINAAKWDSLPEDVKKIMTNDMKEVEAEVYPYFSQRVQGTIDQLIAKGMQKVELPPAEAQKLLYAFGEYSWQQFMQKNPKWVPQMYEMVKDYIGK